jgi:hypothetical protein
MPEPAVAAGRVDMRFPIRTALILFAILIPAYLLVFYGIEGTRTASQPWRLTFIVDSNQIPSLRIQQPDLRVNAVVVRFPDERATNAPSETTVVLDRPQPALPFGTRISEDLMFLPGVETLDLFGHEVEIAPRVLVLNRREIQWTSNLAIDARTGEKLSPESRVRKRK